MSTPDDRPTPGEQYSRATGATNLSVGHSDGAKVAVDYLGAAAWAGNAMGHALFRLRCEYEEARSEHVAAEKSLRDREAVAAKLRKAGSEKLNAQAKAIEELAKADAVAARAFILMRLKTLHQVKERMGQLAVWLATKRRFMKPNRVALQLAGRALDVWLDELCRSCDGTGHRGGYSGETQTICRACGGTGKRRFAIGHDDAERQFAGLLLSEMDRAVSEFEAAMKTGLKRSA